MVEEIVSIGDSFKLNGIASLPNRIDQSNSALVILNAGLMHHFGTCRFSVNLARQAAENGTLALRFDLSGIGDSLPRLDSASHDDRVKEEIRTVLDFIEDKWGISRFYLYGLCSGAQNSYKYAVEDDRVCGLVGIDGISYVTLKYYYVHYLPRIVRLSVWTGLFKRQLLKFKNLLTFKQSVSKAAESNAEIDSWPDYPPRREVEKGLQKLVDRDTQLYYIFTGSRKDIYNYSSQFYDMYPNVDFGNTLRLEFLPEASHVMKEPHWQQHITSNILDWIQSTS